MKKFVVYGAATDVRYKRVQELIKSISGKLIYWVDSSPEKWDASKKIFSPQKILENPEAIIIINCFPVKKVTEYLRKIGCDNEICVYPFLSYYFYIENEREFNFLKAREWTLNHRQELLDLYEMNDDITNRILRESIEERTKESPELVSVDDVIDILPLEYFYDEQLNPTESITLIDGGAFIGDSIMAIHKIFGNRLKKVYAFEPDKKNIEKMKENLLKINLLNLTTIVPCGMFDCEGKLFFVAEGSMTSSLVNEEKENAETIDICKIDNIVKDVCGDVCIKMDIEGSEIPALKGAAEVIRKYKPYMAICVYHKHRDILEVPKTIKEICPHYKFYLRGGFHTECYAIPIK